MIRDDAHLIEMKEDVSDVQNSLHRLLRVRRVLAAVGHLFIQSHLPADRRILQLQINIKSTFFIISQTLLNGRKTDVDLPLQMEVVPDDLSHFMFRVFLWKHNTTRVQQAVESFFSCD